MRFERSPDYSSVRSRLMDHFHLDDGQLDLRASTGSSLRASPAAGGGHARSVDDLDGDVERYRRTERLVRGTPFAARDRRAVSPDLRGFRLQHLFNATVANFNADARAPEAPPPLPAGGRAPGDDGEDLRARVEELQQRRLRRKMDDAVSFIFLPPA